MREQRLIWTEQRLLEQMTSHLSLKQMKRLEQDHFICQWLKTALEEGLESSLDTPDIWVNLAQKLQLSPRQLARRLSHIASYPEIRLSSEIMQASILEELLRRGRDLRPFLKEQSKQPDSEDMKLIQSILEPSVFTEIAERLQRYQELRQSERELREIVYMLEEGIAHKGVLGAEPEIKMKLRHNQEKLYQHREDLKQLEQELDDAIQDYYENESLLSEIEKQIKRDRIEQLVMEIRYKQNQILIYENNVRILERRAARHGLDSPVDLVNELELTKHKIEEITIAQHEAEIELQEQYYIDPKVIQGISFIKEEEIGLIVEEMAIMYAKKHKHYTM